MKVHGESFRLCLDACRWQVFGTLTFASQRLFKQGVPTFWRMMRYACEETGAEYTHLLMCVRTELGEKTGRYHLHFLLGGLPDGCNLRTLSGKLDHWWRFRMGIAQIRPFQQGGGDLVGYLVKSLSSGDEHELNKFGAGGGELILSNSVFRVVRRNRIIAEREYRKQCCYVSLGASPCDRGRCVEETTPF